MKQVVVMGVLHAQIDAKLQREESLSAHRLLQWRELHLPAGHTAHTPLPHLRLSKML